MSDKWLKIFEEITGKPVKDYATATETIAQPPEKSAAHEPVQAVRIPAARIPLRTTTMNNKPIYIATGIIVCLICFGCYWFATTLQVPPVLTEPIYAPPGNEWIGWLCTILGAILIAGILYVTRKRR